MAKDRSNLVSGKFWSLTLWGEVPVGVKDEQWAAIVHNSVSVALALTGAMQQSQFGIGNRPPEVPGGNTGPKLA